MNIDCIFDFCKGSPSFISNIAHLSELTISLPEIIKKNSFSDDFMGNISSLICVNSLIIKS